MSWTGLIMAGGMGRRMAQSGIAKPKPLVKIAEKSLLERNCAILLAAGCSHLAIAVARSNDEVVDATRGPARQAAALGATFELLIEDLPLGNFGATAMLATRQDAVLVVYADNLTTLDLGAMVAIHLAGGAALTLAAHLQPFEIPYGEILVDPATPDDMLRYLEKPTHLVLVSSGIAAVAPEALDLVPFDRPLGLSAFAEIVRSSGRRVALHRHDAQWIDVNDAAAAAMAEHMVRASPAHFGGGEA